MSIVGYVKGNPDVMLLPVSGGNIICGYGIAENYPYLYNPNLNYTAGNPTALF